MAGKEAEGAGGGAGGGAEGKGDDAWEKAWEDIDYSEVELGRKIGGGGFAIVHEARWRGRKVAMKTMVRGCARASRAALWGTSLADFEDPHAGSLASLRHPTVRPQGGRTDET